MGLFAYSTTAADNGTVGGANVAEGCLGSGINNAIRGFAAEMAKHLLDTGGALTTTGSSNAYVLTTNGGVPDLANGRMLVFIASFDNTSAATLNVDGLGAKAIRMPSPSGDSALIAGDILEDAPHIVFYSTTANSAAGAWLLYPMSTTWNTLATGLIATAAEIVANTSQRLTTPNGLWSALTPVTLTDGATVTPNFDSAIDFVWTIGGNRTLANPTNIKYQKGTITIIQDATGGRTISSWGSYWKASGGVKPVLASGAGDITVLAYQVRTSTAVDIFTAGADMS